MWLIEEAEERLGNNTQRFKVSTGETLAAIQSVSYCKHANIMAWNCTRFDPADPKGICLTFPPKENFSLAGPKTHDGVQISNISKRKLRQYSFFGFAAGPVEDPLRSTALRRAEFDSFASRRKCISLHLHMLESCGPASLGTGASKVDVGMVACK